MLSRIPSEQTNAAIMNSVLGGKLPNYVLNINILPLAIVLFNKVL